MFGILKTAFTIISYPLRYWIDEKMEARKFDRDMKRQVMASENDRIKYVNMQLEKTWKDEVLTYWVVIFLTLQFIPGADVYTDHGLQNLKEIPEWLEYVIIGTFSAGLGIQMYSKWRRLK